MHQGDNQGDKGVQRGARESKGKGEKSSTLLLNIEPLAGTGPLGDRLGKEGHEVLVVALGPSREVAEVEGRRELYGRLLGVLDDLCGVALCR